MKSVRPFLTSASVIFLAMLVAPDARAQVDLSGNWGPRFHEDQPERLPGPALTDYLGLPINRAARRWALSWDAARLSLKEHQCQVHTVAYIYRGPLQLRIWEERDPDTQEVIAIRNYISTYEQSRTIWMDGRSHPPDHYPHTWMGFSTGEWEGNRLKVTTTHIKQGWHRRNGLPSSDQITLREEFIRHGDFLTHISIVEDPIYLNEPLIKSQNFVLNVENQGNWLWPCEYVVEVAEPPEHAVQHFLPGRNPFLEQFSAEFNIPLEAVLGGAETMYPEYRQRLEALSREGAQPQ